MIPYSRPSDFYTLFQSKVLENSDLPFRATHSDIPHIWQHPTSPGVKDQDGNMKLLSAGREKCMHAISVCYSKKTTFCKENLGKSLSCRTLVTGSEQCGTCKWSLLLSDALIVTFPGINGPKSQ